MSKRYKVMLSIVPDDTMYEEDSWYDALNTADRVYECIRNNERLKNHIGAVRVVEIETDWKTDKSSYHKIYTVNKQKATPA